MAKVKNLQIGLQKGTDHTIYAKWEFDDQGKVTSTKIKEGTVVTIKKGSTYYNGVDIPDWVEAKKWIVDEIAGDRVVINKSVDGNNAIRSPININNLLVDGEETAVKANTCDHYEVVWYYATGDGVWFSGGSSNVTIKNAVYTKPSNATKVKVFVKPVSKTYKVNNKDTYYWTGIFESVEYVVPSIADRAPEDISVSEVSINKYTLTAIVKDIEDVRADQIEFYVVKGDSKFKTGVVNVKTQRAVFSCSVTAGGNYRVRCRAINLVGGTKLYGSWSLYSDEVTTIPTAVSNVKCSALSETSIQVKWDKSTNAESYVVEYTTDKTYFDTNQSETTQRTVDINKAIITGLDDGQTWFFRVKAVNDVGDSAWSEIVSKVIGLKPAAPTTWSSTTTAIVGDKVDLYWVHNTEDGSKQTGAEIELTINNNTETIVFTNNSDDDDEYKIYTHSLDLSDYNDGAEILWRIRTKGITDKYGPWSTQRTIVLYAPPTLSLVLNPTKQVMGKWLMDTFNFETDSIYTAYTEDVIETLPYTIVANSGPTSQTPISYHVSVTAEKTHKATDYNGETVIIRKGEEIYSKVFNVNDRSFTFALNASDITFKNNQKYKVTVTVAMNSGLTAVDSEVFTVKWYDYNYEPNASVSIDNNALCAYISPFCRKSDGKLFDNVVLSVYRREYNGSFTEIASDVENDGSVTVTDPHPALDYARYRIVARHKDLNIIGYEDLPGIPIGEPSIVIQWDEKWTEFDYNEKSEAETPPWSGSLLRLPYNVDITEEGSPDVSLVKYIGREHPVTYYGTQKGENGNWSCVIPSTDKETLYALRRLRSWSGDVYVREPSGSGYWANITVSMSIKHRELVIPVSFIVNRVEGGI